MSRQSLKESHLSVAGALWYLIEILKEVFLLLFKELLAMGVEVCPDWLVIE